MHQLLHFFQFQSTSLLRGTTRSFNVFSCDAKFQSTSLLRGTTRSATRWISKHGISIHVPLARDDLMIVSPIVSSSNFNPRPSCEGRLTSYAHLYRLHKISIHVPLARDDLGNVVNLIPTKRFQSTSLLRGTTHTMSCSSSMPHYFNPRPSCEGRPAHILLRQAVLAYFNPRPSCEGRPSLHGGLSPRL